MRERRFPGKRHLRAETDGLFVEPLSNVFREELIDRRLRQAKEVVHGQHRLNEVIHLQRSGLPVGRDRQFTVFECDAEPLQDFVEQGFAFRGFKPHAAHFQVGERFAGVGERPAVGGRERVELDLVVVAIQKRRGNLGVGAGFAAAKLRLEPGEVRGNEVGHTNNGWSAASCRSTMPFLSML